LFPIAACDFKTVLKTGCDPENCSEKKRKDQGEQGKPEQKFYVAFRTILRVKL